MTTATLLCVFWNSKIWAGDVEDNLRIILFSEPVDRVHGAFSLCRPILSTRPRVRSEGDADAGSNREQERGAAAEPDRPLAPEPPGIEPTPGRPGLRPAGPRPEEGVLGGRDRAHWGRRFLTRHVEGPRPSDRGGGLSLYFFFKKINYLFLWMISWTNIPLPLLMYLLMYVFNDKPSIITKNNYKPKFPLFKSNMERRVHLI